MGRDKQYDGVRVASASTIEIDFRYAGQRCKERLKLQPTPANLKRASLHRAAILKAIEGGSFDYSATFPNSKNAAKFSKNPQAHGLTVGLYLDQWLEEKGKRLAASTLRDYTAFVNRYINPALGKILLEDLRWPHVKEMLKPLTCGNGRLKNIQSCLRSALSDAVEDELLDSNIMADRLYTVQIEFDPHEEDDVDPFTADEQQAILSNSPPQFANLIQFALWTGLRSSELVALNWNDIDFERNEVRVNKALTRAAKTYEDTKTPAGRRFVKLLAPALEALEAQKKFTFVKQQEIFQHPGTWQRWRNDKPIRDEFWVKILPLAGVRYRKPYQTRHTYASMMLTAGENPMWVAQQMGHSDWGMIRKVYGRFIPDAVPDAGDKAEKMFAKKADQKVDRNVDQPGPKETNISQFDAEPQNASR